MIIILIAIQIYSHTAQKIEAHELCQNKPDIEYLIARQVICIPTDLIYKNDFESKGAKQ